MNGTAANALLSMIQRGSDVPKSTKVQFIKWLMADPSRALFIAHMWKLWARPSQLPPGGDWVVWLILAGRGFGKTRTAAEWVQGEVQAGKRGRIALISKDPQDARDVMIEGRSGFLNIARPDWRPTYEPSKKRLTWKNGAQAVVYSGEDPDKLRGPEHDLIWGDELCAWRHPQETWDNARFGLRIKGPRGDEPQAVITTTPQPIKVLKEIKADPDTVTTGGSTYENLANLAPAFRKAILSKYEGTRLGRQEIHAELMDEVEGALWSRELLESTRVRETPDMRRIVVSVDPMAKKDKKRKQSERETGITVVGLGEDGHGYVLDDRSVSNSKPDLWARRVISAFHDWGADRVIGEVNNGGDMVEDVIHTRDPTIPVKMVHASRGKWTRAEPISSLYEQGKIHHVGFFKDLETQLCTWSGEDNEPSPDRLDAVVWGLTETMLGLTLPDIDIDPAIGRGSNYWSG